MKISAIVAVADNGVMGRSGGGHMGLPWRIRSEFAYFKKTTMGHPLIHGRKSFDAMGKALPGRTNIVITRDAAYAREGVIVVHTLQDAIEKAKAVAAKDGKDEIFICGGAEIYRQALPLTQKLYFTEVHLNPEGDIRFPAFDRTEWTEIKREFHKAQEGEDGDYTITVLERK